MSKNRHKRKVSHILIYTTDAVDADMKQVRIHPWVLAGVTQIVCCVMGDVIGYADYEGELWGRIREHDASQNAALIAAQDEKDALQEKIDEQDAKIEMLSITIQDQTQQIAELQAQIAEQSVPTDYPLTGSASMTVITDGDPMVEFTATEGSTVVAAGKGVVTAVEEDEVYGNRVVIDLGNGYVSFFRNLGESLVKAGDEVASGTTLFMVTEDNRQLGYQIKENDVYIDPTTIIAIKG